MSTSNNATSYGDAIDTLRSIQKTLLDLTPEDAPLPYFGSIIAFRNNITKLINLARSIKNYFEFALKRLDKLSNTVDIADAAGIYVQQLSELIKNQEELVQKIIEIIMSLGYMGSEQHKILLAWKMTIPVLKFEVDLSKIVISIYTALNKREHESIKRGIDELVELFRSMNDDFISTAWELKTTLEQLKILARENKDDWTEDIRTLMLDVISFTNTMIHTFAKINKDDETSN